MNRLLHKLLYRILPLGGYLQTVSAMFFLSHRLGIGRHAPATEYTFHLDRLMRAGDLAIDIGANLGYYARLMSRIAGRNGHVYAVEPVAPIRRVLERNLSGCGNVDILPYALGAAEGEDQLERDADAGKMLERKAAVRAVGVDHGAGGGQLVLTFVVIGDDEVDAEGGGKGGLLHAGDAAVHGDDERDALLGKRADRIAAEAVALLYAAGDVHEHRRPAGAEIIGQKAGGGDAVHVVIAEHGDGLAAGNRPLNPLHSPVHVPHPHGRDREAPLPVQKLRGLLRRGNAAGGQHGGKQIGVSRLPQPGDVLVSRGMDIPFFEFHEAPPPLCKATHSTASAL